MKKYKIVKNEKLLFDNTEFVFAKWCVNHRIDEISFKRVTLEEVIKIDKKLIGSNLHLYQYGSRNYDYNDYLSVPIFKRLIYISDPINIENPPECCIKKLESLKLIIRRISRNIRSIIYKVLKSPVKLLLVDF